jgi:DNA-binding transcriptional LysR family regulator
MPTGFSGVMIATLNSDEDDELYSCMSKPLDGRQIRAFCTLAKTGSFTQAARELHVTQSGISHSMKALEHDIGCRLLDRLGKKVVLTQAGEQLLHHSKKILQEMDTARETLGRLGKWGRGRLRLGASTTACQHIIPPVLREFKESFPEHAIAIQPGDTPELTSALLNQQVDLALSLVMNEPQLEFHPLFNDELHFIVAPLHPWAKARRVERSEIPRQNYILYKKRSVTFALIEDYFRQEQMVLNTIIELGSMEATKELVKLGIGVSILAPWIARKEIEEGSLVALPLGRRKLQRRWGIMHWRGKRLNLAEETFIGLCESASVSLRKLMSDS